MVRAARMASGSLTVVEQEPPRARPGHARVRVRLAGICSTDLQLLAGYMGFQGTPGHEFVGEVLEGSPHLRGRRVVGEINAACGACPACAQGLGRHCPTRTVLGILGLPGAHAEQLLLPEQNLHVVPDGIPDEAAVFVEPLAAAWHAVEQVPVAGRNVAVLGAGKLGQLVARAARLAGAEVVGVARTVRKLELLARAGIPGVTPDEPRPASFDVVVESTGSEHGLASALRLVRPLGTVVLKTTTHAPVPLDLAPAVVNEVTLVGSRCGRFEPAIRLLASGAVDPLPLVDGRYALAEVAAAYARAARPGALKILVAP